METIAMKQPESTERTIEDMARLLLRNFGIEGNDAFCKMFIALQGAWQIGVDQGKEYAVLETQSFMNDYLRPKPETEKEVITQAGFHHDHE